MLIAVADNGDVLGKRRVDYQSPAVSRQQADRELLKIAYGRLLPCDRRKPSTCTSMIFFSTKRRS